MTETERERTLRWSDPMIGGRAAGTMSGLEYFRRIQSGEIPPPPISELVNFRLAEIEEGRVVFEFEPAEYHYNPIGMVHGGITSTLLDSAMGCTVHSILPAGRVYSTTDMHVRFVRPISHRTGRMSCEGRIVHPGRRMATAEGKLTDARGRLYAHATCSCVISDLG